jgi:hypothetical protein
MRSKILTEQNKECIFMGDGESFEVKLKNGEIYEKMRKVCFDKTNGKIKFDSLKSDPVNYVGKKRNEIEFDNFDDLIRKIDYLRWDI